MQLVTSASQALDAIRVLQKELKASAELASRLGQAHAFYILDDGSAEPLFGFSKFVGYVGLDAEAYIAGAKERSGTNTEHALSAFFDEIPQGSKLFDDYFGKLCEWLARYGKTPRRNVRLMALRPEHRAEPAPEGEDRRILELLLAVADLLPAHQRQEMRARL